MNLSRMTVALAKAARAQTRCVFISHRLADIDVARSVGTYLTDSVGCNIYFSEQDAKLKEAVATGDDQKIVESIDGAIEISTHLLGIVSNRTKGSWWVPYEFGASRKAQMSVALLLLEEVSELPSYLKIARVLRDSDDLNKWAKELSPMVLKLAESVTMPRIPRVAQFRAQYPSFK